MKRNVHNGRWFFCWISYLYFAWIVYIFRFFFELNLWLCKFFFFYLCVDDSFVNEEDFFIFLVFLRYELNNIEMKRTINSCCLARSGNFYFGMETVSIIHRSLVVFYAGLLFRLSNFSIVQLRDLSSLQRFIEFFSSKSSKTVTRL